MVKRGKQLSIILNMAFAISLFLFPTGAFGQDYNSENYKLYNVNFGEQPFITAQDISTPSVTGAGPEVIDLKPYQATISWFTDKSTNSSVFIGRSSGHYDREVAKASEFVTLHEIEILGLSPNVTYYYYVKSTDLFGNSGESKERSFITPLPVPIISNARITDITSNSAKVYFETDYFTTAVVEYIDLTSLEKKSLGETGFSKLHQVDLTDLKSEQKYSIRIVVRDEQGNQSTSATSNFTTLKDTIAPIIDGVKFEVTPVYGKENARIIVSWHTDKPSTSQVVFWESVLGEGSAISTAADESLVNNHLVTLTNLKPQATYQLYAVSVDKSGNVAKSDKYSVLTRARRRTILQIILDNLEEIIRPFIQAFS